LMRGDMVAPLPAVLSEVDDATLPVVFSSNAINYLSPAAAGELVRILARVGARRDLVVLFNEAARYGIQLFDRLAPASRALAVAAPVYVRWRAGTPTVTALGHTGPHGEWLSWSPTAHPYRP
jgi:hypothetical protein